MTITPRRFVSNAALSVLQVFASGVLLFFLYRFLLRELGAEQLGLWSVLLASTSVARLSDLGLSGGVVKFVARYRALGSGKDASDVVQTTAITIAVVMGCVLLLAYPLFLHILQWTLPAQAVPLGVQILPLAVASVWLAAIAGVFQGALDGCQQAGWRNIVMLGTNAFIFAFAWFAVPKAGLVALAYGQAAQSLLLLVANWILLRRFMPELPIVPARWVRARFKEMFSYSFNFQLTMAAVMLCDPATKILMGRFGGLSAAAYYEMAAQLVVRVRSLLVSANQVIVPVVAEMHETTPDRLRDVYLRAYDAVFFVALPVYLGLLLLLPAIAVVWIGHVEPQFLVFAVILIASYFLNNLEVPAYFDNLGTGRLGWNLVSHVVMAVLNLVLGAALGWMWGATGVAAGAALALVIGSAMVLWAVHRHYKIAPEALVPRPHRRMVWAVLGPALVSVIGFLWLSPQGGDLWIATAGCVAAFIVVWCLAAWPHPYRREITRLWLARGLRTAS